MIDNSGFINNGGHNNTMLVILSIFMNILQYFTQTNIALAAGIVAIVASLLAIVNYSIIIYDRFHKKQ